MAIIRRRFLIWLIKAYLKKWGKFIVFSFFVGLAIFFLLVKYSPVLLSFIPFEKKIVTGIAGSYERETIPQEILQKVSHGLTKVDQQGTVRPDLAKSWEIQDDGKTYIFHLKNNIKFSDGTPFTSHLVNYDFTDVSVHRPDDYTIIYTLQDAYAPFLITVARPILHKGYIGTGEYTINNIELNGDFIESLQLLSTKSRFTTETYIFYPSSDALKIAFTLGEITRATGLTDTTIKNASLDTFPNIEKAKRVNYNQLVTVFYNTKDPLLSDKRVRNGLSYALPDVFPMGERAYHPYSPKTKYYNTEYATKRQDLEHAKLLLDTSLEQASSSALPELELKTLTKYKKTAQLIADTWKQVGVVIKVQEVETIPDDFQMYLGDFNVPKDPDQYTLWHSRQIGSRNITKFDNKRIDKLLEDGRTQINADERLRIYLDFQKYLIDETPASFLYFPYEYEFMRK